MRLRPAMIGAAVLLPPIAILALLAYGFTREPRYVDSPIVGRPAPSFVLGLLDGRTIRLEDFRGKVVFLNFWASWCAPCRVEAPMLEATWRQLAANDVVFIGVNTQDEEERARAFVQEFGLTYPNGRDPGGRIAIDYGVGGLPEAFFIDAQGRISGKHVGTLGADRLIAGLDAARRGVVTADQGRGDYERAR